MAVQARIPPACAALHNFIMTHDPNDVEDLLAVRGDDGFTNDNDNDTGLLAATHVGRHEKQRAEALRDCIAQAMWDSYQDLLRTQEGDWDGDMDTA